MGICSSRESTSVVTAKVILEDGRLQEFSDPIRVSQILERNPSCVLCNANDMDFDGFVSAVNGDEELQIGQLYFVLPVTCLNSPLRACEMAALAVKASSALKNTGGDGGRGGGGCGGEGWFWRGPRKADPVDLMFDRKGGLEKATTLMVEISGDGGGSNFSHGFVGHRRRIGGCHAGRRDRKTCPSLSAILEE